MADQWDDLIAQYGTKGTAGAATPVSSAAPATPNGSQIGSSIGGGGTTPAQSQPADPWDGLIAKYGRPQTPSPIKPAGVTYPKQPPKVVIRQAPQDQEMVSDALGRQVPYKPSVIKPIPGGSSEEMNAGMFRNMGKDATGETPVQRYFRESANQGFANVAPDALSGAYMALQPEMQTPMLTASASGKAPKAVRYNPDDDPMVGIYKALGQVVNVPGAVQMGVQALTHPVSTAEGLVTAPIDALNPNSKMTAAQRAEVLTMTTLAGHGAIEGLKSLGASAANNPELLSKMGDVGNRIAARSAIKNSMTAGPNVDAALRMAAGKGSESPVEGPPLPPSRNPLPPKPGTTTAAAPSAGTTTTPTAAAGSTPTEPAVKYPDPEPGARRVTVNGRTFDLTGPALEAYNKALADHQNRVAINSQNVLSGVTIPSDASSNIKASGMQTAAIHRDITGALTPKEMSNAIAQSKKFSMGAPVTDQFGRDGVVASSPSFGKVNVQYPDGTTSGHLPMDTLTLHPRPAHTPMEGVKEVLPLKPEESAATAGETNVNQPAPSVATGQPDASARINTEVQPNATEGVAAATESSPAKPSVATPTPEAPTPEPAAIQVAEQTGTTPPKTAPQATATATAATPTTAEPTPGGPTEGPTAAPEGPTGPARAFNDPERVLRGLPPVDTNGMSMDQVLKMGEDHFKSGGFDLERDYNKPEPSPKDITAATYLQRQLYNRQLELPGELAEAERTGNEEQKANILTEQAHTEDAYQKLDQLYSNARGGVFNRMGQALQTVLNKDFSPGAMKVRVLAANDGLTPTPELQARFDALAADHTRLTAENQQLYGQIASHIQQLADARSAPAEPADGTGAPSQVPSSRTYGPRPSKAITADNDIINRMTFKPGQDQTPKPGPGIPNKEAGVIDFSGFSASDRNDLIRAVRNRAVDYFADGAKTTDDILDRFKEDFPHLSGDDVLDILNSKFAQNRVELTEKELEIKDNLYNLRQAAAYRRSSLASKIGKGAWDTLNGATRSMKTLGHMSGPLNQGRNLFFQAMGGDINAGKAWIAGLKPSVEAWGLPPSESAVKLAREAGKPVPTGGGDAYVRRQIATAMNQPWWKEAKAAGLEDILRHQHGPASAIESEFQTDLTKKIPGLGPLFERSSAGFNGSLNAMALKSYEAALKAAPAAGPERAAYLKDMVRYIGASVGRSVSPLGVASSKASGPLFAPRFTVSKWEYGMGEPFWHAVRDNPQAAKQIVKSYAHGIAGRAIVGGILAKALGAKIDTDKQSPTFGHVLIGPNDVDIYGNDVELVKLAAQMALGKRYAGNEKAAPPDPLDTGYKYVRGKLTPPFGIASDLIKGQYVPPQAPGERGHQTAPLFNGSDDRYSEREPFNWAREAGEALGPIGLYDPVVEARRGSTLSPLSFFGVMTRANESPDEESSPSPDAQSKMDAQKAQDIAAQAKFLAR